MNSYPPELLVQLAPVMFVAGLDVPPSPEQVPSSTSDPPLSRPAQDPFTLLTIRLRDALLSQRITAIWQPDKSKTFQTVLVDKVCSALLAVILLPQPHNFQDIRFPPRKILLSSSDPHSPMHSPLSPLTPTSPLHPDGLVAPIWVFVVFSTRTETTATDDPALDTRLTYIRRQSGLDYRAALFVLSPVSPGELSEFIKRLH